MKTPKKIISLLAGSALFAASFLNAATTDPVGYVTIDIKGGGTTNLVANAGLVKASSFVGIGNVSGDTTLTLAGASWTVDAFASSYYVQLNITGEWAQITSNTSDALTLASHLPNGSGQNFIIRPLNTLDSLFGSDNSAGFLGSATFGGGDIVAPWDASNQNLSAFYYYDTDDNSWKDAANNPAGTSIVYPDESLMVIGSGVDKSIVISGTVQTGVTSGDLFGDGGTNIVPNPYPVPLVIKDSGYESAITGGSTLAESDLLLTWDPSAQNFSAFYFYDTDDNTWKDSSNNAADVNDVIPVGGAAVILKYSLGGNSWVINQTY